MHDLAQLSMKLSTLFNIFTPRIPFSSRKMFQECLPILRPKDKEAWADSIGLSFDNYSFPLSRILTHVFLIVFQVSDTNDNAPVFTESAYSFDVAEDTARGAKVGKVSALDQDQGVNGLVTYTVISDWANDVFSLNPQTGVFTLTSRLDYEEVSYSPSNKVTGYISHEISRRRGVH